MSLESNALVTLADQKTYQKITVATHDSILEMLINEISSRFDEETDRLLRETTKTFYLDGNAEKTIDLPNWPVSSIGSVTEDGTVLTEGSTSDYMLYAEEGYLYKVNGDWTAEKKGILLTNCKAGFKLKEMIYFDSGSEEPSIDDTLVGATSSAEGVVSRIIVTAGTWGGGDAEGEIEFSSVTGTFQDNENVNIDGGSSNVMTVNHPETPTLIPKDLQLAVFKQVAFEFKRYVQQDWGESSRSFPDGSVSFIEKDLLPSVNTILERYRKLR